MKRVLFLGLVVMLTACNAPDFASTPTPTPTPVPPSPVPPSATPAEIEQPTEEIDLSAGQGQVSGIVCYPSEFIPEMTLYFLEINTQTLNSFDHDDGVQPYSVSLDPGTYVAYAYRKGTDLAGSYSEAVPCGLNVACTDHSLIEFQVAAAGNVTDIDICDWVAEPGTVPTQPGGLGLQAPPTPTATPPPGGVSLNCDGTYQRLRIEDNAIYVDNWNGAMWVNAWSKAPDDPFLEVLQPSAGWYEFLGCQKLVAVPIRRGNPHLFYMLWFYEWNGATMSQVYYNEGAYGEWFKSGNVVTYKFSQTLGTVDSGPLGPCKWVTFEHEWDGDSFDQVGSLVEPVPGCVETVP